MSGLTIRMGEEKEQPFLVQWLSQPGVLKWFPLSDLREIEDAARIWISYAKQHAVLTALWDGIPCGIANLYIQPFKKLSHQCLLAIIVDEAHRGKGIGTALLHELVALAQNRFHLEMIHLEVYEGNPAIRLYEKMGFKEYGRQTRFIKEDGVYLSKVLMEKVLR